MDLEALSKFNPATMGKLFLAVIIAIVILVSISHTAQTIQVADLHPTLQPLWSYLTEFFSLAPTILMIAVGRNILGYLYNFWKTNYAVTYDFNRAYMTWCWYLGGLTTILTAVPEPWNGIGAMIIVLLDFIISELGHLKS